VAAHAVLAFDVMRSVPTGVAMLLLVEVGCSKSVEPTPDPRTKANPDAAVEAAEHDTGAEVSAPAAPLSAEDLALIEADPATLTPEQRRKRGYALRRKVMQNPDSPAARTLEDLRRAHEEGLLELPPGKGDGGVVLSTPGAPPSGGPGPAGARPERDPSREEADR
jgi:hypothetical protein